MKKQQLEKLRELEKEIKETSVFTLRRIKLKKEAQEIKDNWKDGCFEETGKKSLVMGLNCDGEHWLCPLCEKQNKEKDEILGRILG